MSPNKYFIDAFGNFEIFKNVFNAYGFVNEFPELLYVYDELKYKFRYVPILEPSYFEDDFKMQTRNIREKYSLLTLLHQRAITDIKQLLPISILTNKSILNDTPVQELLDITNTQINNSSEQNLTHQESYRLTELNIKLQTYKKAISDGIREIAEAYQILFWQTIRGCY